MRLAPIAAAAGLALILAACSGGATAAPTTGSAAITLTEFKYAPGNLEVKAGEPFKLSVKNAGQVEHDFTIDSLGLKVSLKAGQAADRQIKALEAGTYEIYCSIPGHKEAGMKGKIIVSK